VDGVSLRLWLVRHGATDWSEAGRLCGWTDVPLNRRGEEQAAIFGRRVNARRFAGVWTSDLLRASRVASIAFGSAEVDPRLRELDFGRLEGSTWEECDPMTQDALLRFDGFTAPGGESTAELHDRVHAFLRELESGDHLVFTHGGVIRLLGREAGSQLFPAPGEMISLDWPAPSISSAARETNRS
jgi:probable phosphoglycerate mutase